MLTVAVTVLGTVEDGGAPPPCRASGARPGTRCWSRARAAGRRRDCARCGPGRDGRCGGRLPAPRGAPRGGEEARLGGAHAMIDVSDGLALDLHRLADASGVGFVLDASRWRRGRPRTRRWPAARTTSWCWRADDADGGRPCATSSCRRAARARSGSARWSAIRRRGSSARRRVRAPRLAAPAGVAPRVGPLSSDRRGLPYTSPRRTPAWRGRRGGGVAMLGVLFCLVRTGRARRVAVRVLSDHHQGRLFGLVDVRPLLPLDSSPRSVPASSGPSTRIGALARRSTSSGCGPS